MYRKQLEHLKVRQRSPTRKPLLLTGARQVGKTFLLKEFGKEFYQNTIYINFDRIIPEISSLFETNIDPQKILTTLAIYFKQEIIPGKTLLIFDEIQEFPKALTALKYFNEEAKEYHIVASGSLLGVALHAGTSFPVGQVEFLHLEPLDFEEFLLANGEGKLVELYKADPKQIFDQTLSEYLKYYFFTGGMPAVVQSWITEKNVEKVETLQEEILRSYLFDFSKHTDSAITRKINQIRKAIPKQFAKENDKFMRGLVREGARAREYELALQWIIDSGVGRKVPRVKRGDKLPLLAYKEDSAFKLYFLDVGLLRKLANIPSKVVLGKEAIFYEFNGMLAEQFVLQNMADYQLFYRTSGANAEVDFVVQFEDSILPIEVKSGENTQSKSLKVYREKYQPKMSIRFSLKKYIVQDGLINVPLYLIFVIRGLMESKRSYLLQP